MMSSKLKALGLCLVATLAMSVGFVPPAPAETGGHFISEAEHTILDISHTVTHNLEFQAGPGGEIVNCLGQATYEGTLTTATATEVTVTPSYGTCTTTGSNLSVTVTGFGSEECAFVLTISKEPEAKESTAHLECKPGKFVTLDVRSSHHGGFLLCTIKFEAQTPTEGGVTYTTIGTAGKGHEITLHSNAKKIHYDTSGLCGSSATKTDGTLSGSVTIKGTNTEGAQVGITATGPVPEFHSEVTHTLLTGTKSAANVFTFGVLLGSVECEVATFDGTSSSSTTAELTLKPAYSKCVGLKREVTAHLNGCAYVLTLTGSGTDGALDIECPAGQAIETTVDSFPEGCTITIGPQTAGGVVDYKGEGSGSTRDLLVTWTIEGLKYKRDGCEIGGEGNNGTYTGSVTLKGENTSGEQKGIWIE